MAIPTIYAHRSNWCFKDFKTGEIAVNGAVVLGINHTKSATFIGQGVLIPGRNIIKIDVAANYDVDTKAIYVPNITEAICEKDRLVKTIFITTDTSLQDEHCEVMDIRHMVANYRKQNINFVETLFTDYCWVNPKYKDLWDKYFISQREAIARYNVYQGISSAVGQVVHTLKQDPTNGKKIANGYRFKYFVEKYVDAFVPYNDCITIPNGSLRNFILKLKTSEETFPPIFAETLIEEFNVIQQEVAENFVYNTDKMLKIDESMNEGIIKIIMRGEEL